MAIITKVRAIENYTFEKLYQDLYQNGYKNIIKWIITGTGTTSGTATEVAAPNGDTDGSVEEVTTVAFNTKALSIGSEYLSIPFSAAAGGSTDTMHYFWFSKAEITTVTFGLTMAEMTDASTFTFVVDDGDGTVTEYYIWFDLSDGASDPGGTGTGVEAVAHGATTAADVAEIVKDAIHALGDVACTRSGDDIIIVNANDGEVVDAAEEIAGTGCTFAIEQGGDDPSATGTGHNCDISGATSASDVGTIVVAAADGVAGISATGTTTMTVESDNTGDITDVAQSGASFGTITKLNEGRATYEGALFYIVSSSASDDGGATDHCQEVTVLGWDEDGKKATEVVSMNGTTVVKLTQRFKRLTHMWGSKFGTGDDDAAGNIILITSATANKTTLLTIAAGSTESVGARIHIPNGQNVLIWDMEVSHTTNANTGSTIVTAHLTGFEDASNTDPDYDVLHALVNAVSNHSTDSKIARQVRIGTNAAMIIFKETEAGTEGNETAVIAIEIWTFTE